MSQHKHQRTRMSEQESLMRCVEEKLKRPSWQEYWISILKVTAERSTCKRRQVGCLIINEDNQLLSTGYNGSPSGTLHCCDLSCVMVDGHCVRTVHAEQNAIAAAAKNGISLKDTIAYVTARPCIHCMKLLYQAGIYHVKYLEDYGELKILKQVFKGKKLYSITLYNLSNGNVTILN